MRRIVAFAVVLVGCFTKGGSAQRADSAAFIIRLGHDTVALERYVRTDRQLTAMAVQRSPATTVHRLIYNFGAAGQIESAEYGTRRPEESVVETRAIIRFVGDSATVETVQGENRRTQRVAARGAIPIAGPFYTPYELAIMRVVTGAPAATVLSGSAPVAIKVQRIGADSVALNNQFDEPMRAHIDARGRLLHLHTPAYTTVERVRWIDLEASAREFAARDAAGKALGQLSPRVTTRRRVADANVWLDYGSPRMRGRPVWGALVPWGQVWRMGANDAAHLATDRTLQIGDLTVPPGTYTLFLLPNPQRWELVISRATGISGLDYDPAKDLGRTPLTLTSSANPAEAFQIDVAPGASGPVLRIQWDRTTASVPIVVKS